MRVTIILIASVILTVVTKMQHAFAFGGVKMSSVYSAPPNKVIVAGAAGRTGRIIFSLLNKKHRVETVGTCRTENSAIKLMKETKCGLDQLVVCDITDIGNRIPKRLEGSEAMVICTSAVPTISKMSKLNALLKIPINIMKGKKVFNQRSLRFKYRSGQHPEKVDYEGQKNLIDLAKKIGVKHVIIISSMGGTDPQNFLNSIGKDKNGNGNGDILMWKREAEKYLIQSGLSYTIIHPGGLRDNFESGEELVLDVNDRLLKREKKNIDRVTVANLCIAALTYGKDKNVSFDCITREVEDGAHVKSVEEVFASFLASGQSATYDCSSKHPTRY